jgi:hypothetical protein
MQSGTNDCGNGFGSFVQSQTKTYHKTQQSDSNSLRKMKAYVCVERLINIH